MPEEGEVDIEGRRLAGMDPMQRIWMFIMFVLHWCCIGASIMIIVAECFITTNSLKRFTDQYGAGEAPARGYDKRAYQEVLDYNPYCGYVSLTNVPKHLGSIIWSTGWQIFIIIAAFLIIFADLAIAIPGNNNYPWKVVKYFWLDGMTYDNEIGLRNPSEDPRDYSREYPNGIPNGKSAKPIPFFLAALGFFKVFLTFGYLSQSFYGLDNGLNEWGESTGPNTQLFCLWAGFILAGSALVGLITGCFLFLAKSPRLISTERDTRYREKNQYPGMAAPFYSNEPSGGRLGRWGF